MLKFSLRLFFVFLFITHAQKAITKNTDDYFILAPININNPNSVTNFPLTEDFLVKIEQIKKDLENLPSEPEAPNTGNDNSIEGLIASVSARPQLSSVLEKNNITPKDYVIGVTALQATLAAVSSIEYKDPFPNETAAISKNNLKFEQKYINRIRALLDN